MATSKVSLEILPAWISDWLLKKPQIYMLCHLSDILYKCRNCCCGNQKYYQLSHNQSLGNLTCHSPSILCYTWGRLCAERQSDMTYGKYCFLVIQMKISYQLLHIRYIPVKKTKATVTSFQAVARLCTVFPRVLHPLLSFLFSHLHPLYAVHQIANSPYEVSFALKDASYCVRSQKKDSRLLLPVGLSKN